LHAVDVGRSDQPSFQCVGPAVIPTAQHIPAAAALRNRSSAVSAHIAECAQGALPIAYHDDRFSGDFGREKRFWISNRALDPVYLAAGLAQRAHKLPSPPENLLLLDLQRRRIGVEP